MWLKGYESATLTTSSVIPWDLVVLGECMRVAVNIRCLLESQICCGCSPDRPPEVHAELHGISQTGDYSGEIPKSKRGH